MNTSESIQNIATAMHQVQSGAIFAVADRQNQQTRSRYANLTAVLAALLPALKDTGLSFMQMLGPIREAGGIHTAGITTRIMHTSGEWLEHDGEFPLPPPPKSKTGSDILNYAQTHGLGLTYARRYALLAAFGIATGDEDDGERLTSKVERTGPNVKVAEETRWQSLMAGFWQDWDAPGLGKTLGECSKEELAQVRKDFYATNPAVTASVADGIMAIIGKNGGTWADVMDYGPMEKAPQTVEDCTPDQLREVYRWVLTNWSQKGTAQ